MCVYDVSMCDVPISYPVQLDEDILLMRETLQAKMREAQVLKQKLGITMWTEFTQDVNHSLQSVRESQA